MKDVGMLVMREGSDEVWLEFIRKDVFDDIIKFYTNLDTSKKNWEDKLINYIDGVTKDKDNDYEDNPDVVLHSLFCQDWTIEEEKDGNLSEFNILGILSVPIY